MFARNQYLDCPSSTFYASQLKDQHRSLPPVNSANNGHELDFSFLNNPPDRLCQTPYEHFAGLSRLGYQLQPIFSHEWDHALADQQNYTKGHINSQRTGPEFRIELDTGAPSTHLSPPNPFSPPPGPFHPESSSGSLFSPCDSSPNTTATIIGNEFAAEPWPLEPECSSPKVPPVLTRSDHEDNQADMGRRLLEMARRLEAITLSVSRDLEYKHRLVQGMQSMLKHISSPKFSELLASDTEAYRMQKDTSRQGGRENIPEFLREFGTPPPREALPADQNGRPRCELGRPVGKILTPEEAKGGFNRCSKHREANFVLNMAIHRKQKNPWSPWACQ